MERVEVRIVRSLSQVSILAVLVGCGGGEMETAPPGEPLAEGGASVDDAGANGSIDAPTDAAPPSSDAMPSADGGGDGSGGSGCPKTSCEAYATSTAACTSRPYSAWKDVCDNAAKKCAGPNLPDCFCSSDCWTRRYCFLEPCKQ